MLYPKNISVIILSYNRPNNIKKCINYLLNINIIDEIIISHGSMEYYVNFQNIFNNYKIKDIIDIDNNNKYKCGRRFLNIIHAKNDIILFLDDDLIPSYNLINEMYKSLLQNYNKNTIYGPFRRYIKKDKYYSYSDKIKRYYNQKTKKRYLFLLKNNRHQIVLPGLSLIKKTTVLMYLKYYFPYYSDWLIKYKGNCEDIAFNLFIIYFLKEKPVYINTYDWKQFPSDESYSSQDNHYKIRELFLLKYNNKYLLE